jgi:ppGpp synthetase/RelA/SpoT-type nucleotidyltranferase
MIKIGSTEENILFDVSSQISNKLDQAGIFNRVFARIKSRISIEKKLLQKGLEYKEKNKKMQDVFGIRVTLYFVDDESIAIKIVKGLFQEVPDAHSIDNQDKERFGPVRNNLVFRIDQKHIETSSLFDQELIDSTFEVQFRTIFSEGWHEVEHDLRYKCKKDWENEHELSRQLNGQLAVLEASDWAMLKIFDELSYKKYKAKEWNSFFRNALRIRFDDLELSPPILQILNKNTSLAKELLRVERSKLIQPLINLSSKVPLKMDNVIFILNRNIFKNDEITQLETESMKSILSESFPI